MDAEEIRDHCISKKGVSEEFPFDDVTLVFKVMGKIFCLLSLDGNLSLNLKCDPSRSVELRESYPAVRPGYHMNKKHWITVDIDGSMNQDLIMELIDHSYDMVIAGLNRNIKNQLDSI